MQNIYIYVCYIHTQIHTKIQLKATDVKRKQNLACASFVLIIT